MKFSKNRKKNNITYFFLFLILFDFFQASKLLSKNKLGMLKVRSDPFQKNQFIKLNYEKSLENNRNFYLKNVSKYKEILFPNSITSFLQIENKQNDIGNFK